MASLAAAFNARQEAIKEERSKREQARFRLACDPFVSVTQIQNALEGYMRFKNTTDLWSLISPPPNHISVKWQSPPSPEWMIKVSGLAYEILAFAGNTKLASTKVRKALCALYQGRSLSLPQNLGKPDDAIDRIDISLRIVMNQFREVKIKEDVKAKVMRCLPRDKQVQLELVLARVNLPQEAYSNKVGDDQDDEPREVNMLAIADGSVLDAPVAAVPPKQEQDKEQSKKEATVHRPVFVHKPCSDDLAPVPSIFQKILDKQEQAPGPEQKPAQTKMQSMPGFAFDENKILAEALVYVPPQAFQESRKKKPSSKEKMQGGKVDAPETKTKTKPKAVRKNAKKKAAPKKKPAAAAVPSGHSNQGPPAIPEYVVDSEPLTTDNYRNKYTSRHYHKAMDLALTWGLDDEAAKVKARKAGKEAGVIWDRLHPK